MSSSQNDNHDVTPSSVVSALGPVLVVCDTEGSSATGRLVHKDRIHVGGVGGGQQSSGDGISSAGAAGGGGGGGGGGAAAPSTTTAYADTAHDPALTAVLASTSSTKNGTTSTFSKALPSNNSGGRARDRDQQPKKAGRESTNRGSRRGGNRDLYDNEDEDFNDIDAWRQYYDDDGRHDVDDGGWNKRGKRERGSRGERGGTARGKAADRRDGGASRHRGSRDGGGRNAPAKNSSNNRKGAASTATTAARGGRGPDIPRWNKYGGSYAPCPTYGAHHDYSDNEYDGLHHGEYDDDNQSSYSRSYLDVASTAAGSTGGEELLIANSSVGVKGRGHTYELGYAECFEVGMDINILLRELNKNTLRTLCVEDYDQTGEFGDQETIVLAAALKDNTSLMSLQLRFLPITDLSVVPLCAALEKHPSLRAIDLSGCKANQKGIQAIRKLVSRNSTVLHVLLEKTNAKDDDLDFLELASMYNGLMCSDPSNNPYDKGLIKHLAGAEKAQQLLEKQLSYNPFAGDRPVMDTVDDGKNATDAVMLAMMENELRKKKGLPPVPLPHPKTKVTTAAVSSSSNVPAAAAAPINPNQLDADGNIKKSTKNKQQQQKKNTYKTVGFALFGGTGAGADGSTSADAAAATLAEHERGTGSAGRVVCGNYMSGRCVYGSRCKYYHPERTTAIDNMIAQQKYEKEQERELRRAARMSSATASEMGINDRGFGLDDDEEWHGDEDGDDGCGSTVGAASSASSSRVSCASSTSSRTTISTLAGQRLQIVRQRPPQFTLSVETIAKTQRNRQKRANKKMKDLEEQHQVELHGGGGGEGSDDGDAMDHASQGEGSDDGDESSASYSSDASDDDDDDDDDDDEASSDEEAEEENGDGGAAHHPQAKKAPSCVVM